MTGAGKPLRGAAVTLYAGSHEGVRKLGSASTDATGSFEIAYAKPADSMLYVEAAATGDRKLLLRSVVGIGQGGGVPQRTMDTVVVNELTTVATTYALAQFADKRGITGPSPGLQNAAATAWNLADPGTGTPGAVVTADNANHQTLATLNTLANLTSLCAVNSARCDRVLRLATPPGAAPAEDTVQALLNLVHHPTLSRAGLSVLAGTEHVFAPALDAAPDTWVLAVRYTANGLYSAGRIAFDAHGNVWASNNWLPGTRTASPFVTVLDPVGRPALGSPISGGGMKGGAWGITIDPQGFVWAPSYGSNAMVKYSPAGVPLSPATGFLNGGLVAPQGVAVDQRGNLWVTNSYGLRGTPGLGSVVVYPHGDPAKAFTIGADGFNHPFGVQIDDRGRAWITNSHMSFGQLFQTRQTGSFGRLGGSVTVIGPDFKPVAAIHGSSLQGPLSFAFDSHGNAWVASFINSTVTRIRRNGTIDGVYRLPKRTFPWSTAVDGLDRVWVAGFGDKSVSLLCGVNTTACPRGASTGTILSPKTGFRNEALQHPTAVQIDSSGNLWLTNNWSKVIPPTGGVGLVELIGLASPVCTPLTPLPERPSANGCSKQPSAASPPLGSTAEKDRTGHYIIRRGDTLSSIGRAHGQSWPRLYRKNRNVLGPDPDLIFPGQTITLG
ncbi:LysM peptidoglycan-binding domain-containing protein [Streptomyces sp. NPDC001070]